MGQFVRVNSLGICPQRSLFVTKVRLAHFTLYNDRYPKVSMDCMDVASLTSAALEPLEYHSTIVEHLQNHEPDVWRWALARTTDAEQVDATRVALLRDTYRIDAEVHPEVHIQLAIAMERLGIAAPSTLYQAPGRDPNAMLVYTPGEVHIVLQGPLLERLTGEELLAVFGHELAHYLLWSSHGGRYFIADRILCDAIRAPGAGSSFHETYRRYVLHTELYADRGGAIAAGAIAPAVAGLVKIQTGMANVDAAAYLRQAGEVEAQASSASEAHSHPETFIRARALSLWWESAPELTDWLQVRLHGPLKLERLDLPDQRHLCALTRGFLAYYLAGTELASEAVLAQLRSLFPDWGQYEAPAEIEAFAAGVVDDGVRRYLNALMLDLALADPEKQDAAIARAGNVAQALGSLEDLLVNLRRDAGFGKRELDKFKRQLAKGG